MFRRWFKDEMAEGGQRMEMSFVGATYFPIALNTRRANAALPSIVRKFTQIAKTRLTEHVAYQIDMMKRASFA
jgi:hypothetical protein